MSTDGNPGAPPAATAPQRRSLARTLRLALAVNAVLLVAIGLFAEAAFRVLWHPTFWFRCDDLVVGSGQSKAGRKWWPDAHYRIEGKEFDVRFRTNALGYRTRPAAPRTERPYRVAFVGDSFTEGVQVEYEQTFVAQLERGLATACDRELIAENYGVAGTGFFEYWHRVAHDVFRPGTPAPEAVVLCIYPGNDFTDPCPDDGFERDGRPRRDYFGEPRRSQHVLAWLNLKSKLAHFVLHALHLGGMHFAAPPPAAPAFWWSDPNLAAASAEAPGIRHIRALVRAIEDECGRHGSRLVIVVVGPVNDYALHGGPSPFGRILDSWGIRAPVIDVAARANVTKAPGRLVFFRDGHLNPAGHQFAAETIREPLARALGFGLADSPDALAVGRQNSSSARR